MMLCECRKQARAGSEANIHKASFIKRRLFYLNSYCHCEGVPCPKQSLILVEIASSGHLPLAGGARESTLLAMTMYKGMQ